MFILLVMGKPGNIGISMEPLGIRPKKLEF
jgi:hypothetical protein